MQRHHRFDKEQVFSHFDEMVTRSFELHTTNKDSQIAQTHFLSKPYLFKQEERRSGGAEQRRETVDMEDPARSFNSKNLPK